MRHTHKTSKNHNTRNNNHHEDRSLRYQTQRKRTVSFLFIVCHKIIFLFPTRYFCHREQHTRVLVTCMHKFWYFLCVFLCVCMLLIFLFLEGIANERGTRMPYACMIFSLLTIPNRILITSWSCVCVYFLFILCMYRTLSISFFMGLSFDLWKRKQKGEKEL